MTYYKTNIFVETGTGMGSSLEFALRYPFEKVYTIEILEELYNKTKEQFSNHKNCEFINNNSKDGLKEVIAKIPSEKNICFWLDAHFPGADFGLTAYGSTKEGDIRIPLENELRTLCEIRDVSKDVFIIDDLRIYEDGPFSAGNWHNRKQLGGDGIDFIYELFNESHEIKKDYRDQGYVILLPKNVLTGDIHLGSKDENGQ